MSQAAPQTTYFDLGSNVTLDGGNSVYVYGMTFQETAGANNRNITVSNATSGDTIMLVTIDGSEYHHIEVPFYADGGLTFSAGGLDTIKVTVHHSSSGAFGTRRFATKVSHSALTANVPFVIDSGNPINVFGIHFNNTGAGTDVNIRVRTGDGNATTLMETGLSSDNIGDQTKMTIDIPFCADKGLEIISTDANSDDITATVFHTSTGL